MTKRRVTPETPVLHACMLAATKAGARVWRNNTGVLLDQTGLPIRYGLCVGSSDLIGITATGRFIAIECKRPVGGVATPEQKQFLAVVREMGGIAVLATDGEDVTKALGERDEHEDGAGGLQEIQTAGQYAGRRIRRRR